MVTVNERLIAAETHREPGLLGERVERDMEEALNEYGAPMAEPVPERKATPPLTNFAYGIPMAGVRYYTFAPQG